MATPVSGTSTSSIVEASHVAWDDWVSALDHHGARDKPHAEIAQLAQHMITGDDPDTHLSIPEDAKIHSSPGWWAQGVTVAYEQHIGRRAPGQRADGTFEASASRTLPVLREALLPEILSWLDTLLESPEFPSAPAGEPRVSSTEKRDNWRVSLNDGTAVLVSVEPRPAKQGDRAAVVVAHSKIADAEALDTWKSLWKRSLAEFDPLLGGSQG
ncbi:hypothetical protein [Citricoccus sp. NR2]|uniref:hypothetical protein n=1 Tax=Citricoccus sp. NR2 TaxID=3004095 RepID=UPI0022DD33AE|nr:hypothetical protein [Citricoccus sp. NR2]WBL18646.1 hypothetical protein O1A05_12930 [Citricoccus sp. NR2]